MGLQYTVRPIKPQAGITDQYEFLTAKLNALINVFLTSTSGDMRIASQ
jgi:hypothetical protein